MTNLTKADVVAPDAVRSADIVPKPNKRKPNMKTKLSARATLIGSLSLLLTACAIPPETAPMEISMDTIRSADYGTYPNDYEQQIRQYLNDTLLDPDSAKIRITPPRKVFKIYETDDQPSKPKYYPCYLVCAEVNAKNTFGGYAGWQTQRYRFTNGSMEDEQNFSYRNSIDSDACYSTDEIYIDTQNLDKLKVNIIP